MKKIIVLAVILMAAKGAGAMDKIKVFDVKTGKVIEAEKAVKTDKQWRDELGYESFCVMREKDTERPYSGKYNENEKEGIYYCKGCGLGLFISSDKYRSGTGWPSFLHPVSELNITEKEDLSYGMKRTEVLCSRCDAHLGHVFKDGPLPAGLRYCMNSAALKFRKATPEKLSAIEGENGTK